MGEREEGWGRGGRGVRDGERERGRVERVERVEREREREGKERRGCGVSEIFFSLKLLFDLD